MERLTYRDEFGRWTADVHYGGVVDHLRDVPIDRLAAYEDTGLEPEEVASVMQLAEKMSVVDLVRENLRIANRLRYAEARLNGMSALVKAREEGGPCGLCRYSPPSSRDGKPCTMCPAEAALQEEERG